MSPADLLKYFGGTVVQNGDGQSLYFGPDSRMSQLYSQGKGAQAFEKFVYDKFGGSLTTGDTVDDFAYKFNTPRFFGTANLAEHVVGSWGGGQARVVDQQILFRATNTMGASSFFGEVHLTPILGPNWRICAHRYEQCNVMTKWYRWVWLSGPFKQRITQHFQPMWMWFSMEDFCRTSTTSF